MSNTPLALFASLLPLIACGRSEPVPAPASTPAPAAAVTTPTSSAPDAVPNAADAAQVGVAPPGDAARPPGAPGTTDVSAGTATRPQRPARVELAACLKDGDAAACRAAAAGLSSASDAFARAAAKAACDKGDKGSCIRRAVEDRALFTALAPTIHRGATIHGFAPEATNTRACELGDWEACAFVAERNHVEPGAWSPFWDLEALDTPDAGVAEALGKRAVELATKACAEDDKDACLFAAMRTIEGCDATRDVEAGVRAFAPALAIHAGLCKVDPSVPSDKAAESCRVVDGMCGLVARAIGPPPEPSNTRPAAAPAPRPVVVAVVGATASTVLPPWKGYRFTASQLVDGDLTTSWQPLDKKRGGVGQWFELRLGVPSDVVAIEIANGLQKIDSLGDLFAMNNRVTRGTIEVEGGAGITRIPFTLSPDQRGFTTIRMVPARTSFVRVVVDAIARGSKWNDLAVSEVRVLAEPSETAAPDARLPAACASATAVLAELCRVGAASACDFVAAHTSGDTQAAADAARAKALATACEATDKDGAVCERAARATLSADATATATARTLMRKACKLGHTYACGALGCHQKEGEEDAIDGHGYHDTYTRADAAECRAMCDEGDDASCLVLAGAIAYDVASVDFDAPSTAKVIARTTASCGDRDACLALAKEIEAARGDREPIDLVDFVRALAAFERACDLGSAQACATAMYRVWDWADDSPRLAANGKKACALGDLDVCQRMKLRGESVAADFARALAATTKACEGGDPDACYIAAETVDSLDNPSEEATRLRALRHGQLVLRCDAGDHVACGEAAHRGPGLDPDPALTKKELAAAARLCLDEGEHGKPEHAALANAGTLCAPFCEVAQRFVGSLGIGATPPDGAAMGPVLEVAPELTPELLLDICTEIEIEDPCSCGCC